MIPLVLQSVNRTKSTRSVTQPRQQDVYGWRISLASSVVYYLVLYANEASCLVSLLRYEVITIKYGYASFGETSYTRHIKSLDFRYNVNAYMDI